MQTPADDGAGDSPAGEPPTVRTNAREAGMMLVLAITWSVDELNPVKVVCSYTRHFFGLSEWHVAILASVLLVLLSFNQMDHLLYYGARTFFRCTFNNIFFRSVEVVGMENLPKEGPIILTGNHNNQFVDGLILLTNCHREISFMIAQKSWERPLIGFLARAFHCIPVSRPQDMTFQGKGLVVADGSCTLRGIGTSFVKEVQIAGTLLKVNGQSLKVQEVVSDTELVLEAAASASDSDGVKFQISPKVDQSEMYSQVYTSLKRGQCLGIFPEGGSHDRTDLLPLKAGVAIIALEAARLHHLNVPIVPVGLNYFGGHRFGGRVVVEFGNPITIDPEIQAQHDADRKGGACDELLKLIGAGMRSVIVPTPDYHTLQQIIMIRRLWVFDGVKVSTQRAMDLNRRFAVGTYRVLKLVERYSESKSDAQPSSPASSGQKPLSKQELEDFQELRSYVDRYMKSLKKLGIQDHQVPKINWWSSGDLIGRFLYLLVTLLLGVLPHVLFNLPVMWVAGHFSVIEQQKAKLSSSVKLEARDVLMSYKVIYVLISVPLLYIIYSFLIWRYTSWSNMSRILVLLILPFFAFLGMKASEQGVRAWRDMVPLCRRLMNFEDRQEQNALPELRAMIRKKLHSFVDVLGPRLGDLYSAKEVDWSKQMIDFSSVELRSPEKKDPTKDESPTSADGKQ